MRRNYPVNKPRRAVPTEKDEGASAPSSIARHAGSRRMTRITAATLPSFQSSSVVPVAQV